MDSVRVRYVLRATVAAALAVLAVLKASIGEGLTSAEWVDLVYAAVGTFGGYLGLGALIPQVEPNIGVKKRG